MRTPRVFTIASGKLIFCLAFLQLTHSYSRSFSAEVGMTAIITFMVQAFFARRAWFFTRRVGCRFSTSRITKLLGAAICVLTFTQLGFGLAAFELTLTMKEINKVFDYRVIWVGWHASAAACDILIAYMLSSVTDALIDRLLLYTINTGLLTSLVAIVDLVAFCTMYNMVHLALNFALGKLYTNTLLATLNARDAEPQNIIHIEDGSYNLKGFTTHLTSGKFSHPQGAVASQVRSEPVAHIDPEMGLQSPDDETRRGPLDQTAHKVVMPGPKRVSDCDTDSIDTKDESVKQVKEV
ncbi:Transmembrane protein [Ceratobasidium theobromae]|uniref:Transmembrane protein n=1 Tax=Ceratobasidium theobromae TaxID=1582974 RepID=A0A5N5QEE1_9AGAM|nr:Transmembrane protein [Ceratobasidium theobromae]